MYNGRTIKLWEKDECNFWQSGSSNWEERKGKKKKKKKNKKKKGRGSLEKHFWEWGIIYVYMY